MGLSNSKAAAAPASSLATAQKDNPKSADSICYHGQEALDRLADIRFDGLPKWKQQPNWQPPPRPGNVDYDSVAVGVIPNDSDTNNDGNLVMMYNYLGSPPLMISLQSSRSGQTIPVWKTCTLPDMNNRTRLLLRGAVWVGRKLFVLDGNTGPNTFEMLDLDNQEAGWTLWQMPNVGHPMLHFKATVIDNRYIFALAKGFPRPLKFHSGRNAFYLYDTKTENWKYGLKPGTERLGLYDVTSICVPGEGTFVVVVCGYDASHNLEPSVEAYCVESNEWIRLPNLPDGCQRNDGIVSSLGNRYIVVSGGCKREDGVVRSLGNGYIHVSMRSTRSCKKPVSSVIALDWQTKVWFKLPPLPENSFSGRAGALFRLPSTSSLHLVGRYTFMPASLNIAPGIGWAKEKLLLLCFCGKSRRVPAETDEDKKPCLLEDLNAVPGVFANILLFLFTPFPHEVECAGSIFALSSPHLSLSQKRNRRELEAPTGDDDESKKKSRSIY